MIFVIAAIVGIIACCIPMFKVDTQDEIIYTKTPVLGTQIKSTETDYSSSFRG